MKSKKMLFVIYVLIVQIVFATSYAYGFSPFDKLTQSDLVTIGIGDFDMNDPNAWNPNNNYVAGDRFTYNGLLWEARPGGDYSLPPEGAVLRPYGPYQEITDQYRSYNTYEQGDTVIYNGITYVAIYGGMGGKTPGTVVGWNAMTDTWQPFNVYQQGDVVTYGNSRFIANYYTQGNQPDQNVGQWSQWRLLETTITRSTTTHLFDATVLNATIRINGVIVVQNGVIQSSNASSIGVTVQKQPQGNAYWSFTFSSGVVIIRSNNNQIQYQQNPTFNSIVVTMP